MRCKLLALTTVGLTVTGPNPRYLNSLEILHTQPGTLRTDETMLTVYAQHNFSWFYDNCPQGGSHSLVQIMIKARLKSSSA